MYECSTKGFRGIVYIVDFWDDGSFALKNPVLVSVSQVVNEGPASPCGGAQDFSA